MLSLFDFVVGPTGAESGDRLEADDFEASSRLSRR
jgi:hypothetical protein